MKKTLCLILAVVMCLSLVTPAFAASANAQDISLKRDIVFLSENCIPVDSLVSATKDADGNSFLVYRITEDLYSEITVITTAQGRTLHIREGDVFNTLEFLNDGTLILDGKPISVTYELSRTSPAVASVPDPMLPRVTSDMYYTYTCPYGVSGNYSVYYDDIIRTNAQLRNCLINIGASAFLAICCTFLSPMVSIPLRIAKIILTNFQEESPYSDAISYEDWIYRHTKGFYVQAEMGVHKHKLYLYSEVNLGGTMEFCETYQVWILENGEG